MGELERLVVRLVGDADQYTITLRQAGVVTQHTANTIAGAFAAAGVRMNAMGRLINAQGQYVTLLNAQWGNFDTSLLTVGKTMEFVGKKMKRLGQTMTMYLSAPLTLFGIYALKTFADFDKAMFESMSIMGDLSDEMKMKLEATAIRLSETTVTSATDAANAYFYLASAGYSAEQALGAIEIVNEFAIAGLFDLERATTLAADAQAALGMNIGTVEERLVQMRRMTDVLTKANVLCNAEIEQLSVSLTSQAGASLKMFNKDVEEGVAVLAVFANQGMKAEHAGTNLSRVIRLLSSSAIQNAEAHRQLGFSVFDAQGNMRNFADMIENLEIIMADLTDEGRAAALQFLGFEARVQQAIMPLIGSSKAIREFEEELRSAGGYTEEVSDKVMGSFSAQMSILWHQIQTVVREIGEALIPTVQWLSDKVQELIKWWHDLDQSTQQSIVYWGLFVIALGPVLMMLGILIGLIGATIIALGVLLSLSPAVLGMLSAIAIRVGLATGGVTLLIGGLAWLAIKFGLLTDEVDESARSIRWWDDAARDAHNAALEVGVMGGGDPAAAAQVHVPQEVIPGLDDAAIELMTDIEEMNAKLNDAADVFGLTSRQAEIYRLQLRGATAEQVEFAYAMDEYLTSLDVAQKVDELTASLEFQLKTFILTSREVDIFKLATEGATRAQLDAAISLNEQLTTLENYQKALDAGAALTKRMMTPQEKFMDQIAEYDSLLEQGVITMETYDRAVQAARDELEPPVRVTFEVSGINAVEAGTAEALARLEEFRALRAVEIPAQQLAPPQMPRGGVAFGNPQEVRANVMGQVEVGADANRDRIVALLEQIAGSTKVVADRRQIVLEEANITT